MTKEFKLMSEQIYELKELLKEIRDKKFGYSCGCSTCDEIKSKIYEVLK